MKILMITPYVTINCRSEFERNKTGFGYMVYDIAKAVGKKEVVDVLCTDSRGNGFIDDGVKYLSRDMLTYIKNVFASLSLVSVCKLWRQYKMQNGTLLRVVYYWLMTGYLNHLIKDNKYDIVHIHGCGFRTELWMQTCKRCGQKFLVTLHGLNSFNDTVKLERAGKMYERDFLKRVIDGEISITVISSGMKKLIEKTYGLKDNMNISVVCNSFSYGNNNVGVNEILEDIKGKYKIPTDSKILLYVGNISENKNQRQMIWAYCQLPREVRRDTYVLFCGRPSVDGSFEEEVKNSGYEKNLVLCGAVDKSIMPAYYCAADGVVLLSHSEGFGLSLIEGMYFGLPCMMFEDMDAFEDIYDKDVVVPLATRDNKSVSKGLEILLCREWNKGYIIEYSRRFSQNNMANNYVDIYKKIIA